MMRRDSPAEGQTPDAGTDVEICNRRGLHARASAKFVKLAESFEAEVKVSKDGVIVFGSSIMGLMLLVAASGDVIHIAANGRDAAEAVRALETLVRNRFEEGS